MKKFTVALALTALVLAIPQTSLAAGRTAPRGDRAGYFHAVSRWFVGTIASATALWGGYTTILGGGSAPTGTSQKDGGSSNVIIENQGY